jgi:hypothetical protein
LLLYNYGEVVGYIIPVHLTCFSNTDVKKLHKTLEIFQYKHSDLFPKKFPFYGIWPVDEIRRREISAEFGFNNPVSWFMISLKNNDGESEVTEIDLANMLRDELGDENILILYDNNKVVE